MLKIIKRLPIGLCALAIFFLLVQVICSLWLPYVTADIVDNGIAANPPNIGLIWSQGWWMIALSVVSLLGAIGNTVLFSIISYNLGGQLRSDLYRKVLRFSKSEFDKFGTSSLITRNTNDVTQVQSLVEMGLKFIILAFSGLIGGIAMTYLLNPKLALVFLCTLPFLAISYFVVYRFASPLYTTMQRLLDKLNQYFREGLTGVKVIRAFNKEADEYDKYNGVNKQYTHAYITAGTIMSVAVPIVTMLVSLATVVIVWVGGVGVQSGGMEVGAIMGSISYSVQILMGFSMLTNILFEIPRGQVSAKRINEVLDMPITINDPTNPQGADGGSLAFEHVDFRYEGAERKTLEDISFQVNPGQTLAIIGSTGDGKSSLVNLIPRLYDVESGRVKIGGTDVRELEQRTLHQLVSLSPQKSTLFFGTIRSNMLTAKPDATDDEIWAALGLAHATEFVAELDNGLDSPVEKSGGNFSGGQKQRLCIARALLKDSAIYIFDDSFSALDFKTDAEVRRDMRSKLADAITVIVAQRIGTIREADLIAVLDHGRIAGLGTHDQLVESCPIYQEIIDSQYKQNAVPEGALA